MPNAATRSSGTPRPTVTPMMIFLLCWLMWPDDIPPDGEAGLVEEGSATNDGDDTAVGTPEIACSFFIALLLNGLRLNGVLVELLKDAPDADGVMMLVTVPVMTSWSDRGQSSNPGERQMIAVVVDVVVEAAAKSVCRAARESLLALLVGLAVDEWTHSGAKY